MSVRHRRSRVNTLLLAAILLVLIVIAVGVVALAASTNGSALATRTVDWTPAVAALDHFYGTQTAEGAGQ